MKADITVKAFGDIACGDYTIDGHGVASISIDKDCDYLFFKPDNLLTVADLILGDLKGAPSSNRLTKAMRLCGITDLAIALKNTVFDLLSLANNHILDYGSEVFKGTIECCQNAGIKICGLRSYGKCYSEPVKIEINGKIIGILEYNWIGVIEECFKSKYLATVHDRLVNYTWERDRDSDLSAHHEIHNRNLHVLNDLEMLKTEVDTVIVNPHWGFEWVNEPQYGVVLEAHKFIGAGADLIIGAHSHVIQGVETYRNRIIEYSLGDFLFDSSSPKYGSGMVVTCKIQGNNDMSYSLEYINWSSDYQALSALKSIKQRLENIITELNITISAANNNEILNDEIMYQEYEQQHNRLNIVRILYLLRKLPLNPSLMVPISRKVVTLFEILYLRLKGHKIRW